MSWTIIKKVARRYASSLKPPPIMEKEIRDWVFEVAASYYAGFLLKSSADNYGDPYDDLYSLLKQLRYTKNFIGVTSKLRRFSDKMKKEVGGSSKLFPSDLLFRKVESIDPSDMKKIDRYQIEKLIDKFEKLFPKRAGTQEKVNLKFISNLRFRKNAPLTGYFNVGPEQYKGWKHEDFLTNPIQILTVKLDPHLKSRGVYHKHGNEIHIKLPGYEASMDLKEVFFILGETVTHELTHWTQFAIDEMRKKTDQLGSGFPQKKRSPFYQNMGYPALSQELEKQNVDPNDPAFSIWSHHTLDDIEFYPLLNNEVSSLKKILSRYPPDYFTDSEINNIIRFVTTGKKRNVNVYNSLISHTEFFRTLSKVPDQKLKYRKAIKFFSQEIMEWHHDRNKSLK